jgi:hypothetical protein
VLGERGQAFGSGGPVRVQVLGVGLVGVEGGDGAGDGLAFAAQRFGCGARLAQRGVIGEVRVEVGVDAARGQAFADV